MRRLVSLLAIVAALPVWGQTATVAHRLDLSAAGAVERREPVATEAALPGYPTCTAGEDGVDRVVLLGPSGGPELWVCNALAWEAVASGGGGGTDDQTAVEVPITDAGGYYTGTEVESALQEIGADARWTDARTPTAHASTHGVAGGDPVTITEAQISDLVHTVDTTCADGPCSLALGTTLNGATIQTGTDDDVPDAGEVALSALANGTAGNLITYDAAGAPAVVATGTAAQVLTSNGAGLPPTFQAAAGGSGDVVGPASVPLDNAIARFSGTTGKLIDGTTSGYPLISDASEISMGSNSKSARLTTTLCDSGAQLQSSRSDSGLSVCPAPLAYYINEVVWSTWWASAGDSGLALHGNTSTTSPRLRLASDTNSGYGWGGADDLRLIAGGVSGLGQTATETTLYVEQVNSPAARTCADSGDASPGFLSAAVSGISNMEVTVLDTDGCVLILQETGATGGQNMTVSLAALAGGTLDLVDSSAVQETGTGCSLSIDGTATFIYNLARTRWLMTGCEPTN